MNPHQGFYKQFPPRNVVPSTSNARGMHVPPPPLPPWSNLPNTVIPPPPLPPVFSPHQVPQTFSSDQFYPDFSTFPPPQFPQSHPSPQPQFPQSHPSPQTQFPQSHPRSQPQFPKSNSSPQPQFPQSHPSPQTQFPQSHPSPQPVLRAPDEKPVYPVPSRDTPTGRRSEQQIKVDNWLRNRTFMKSTTKVVSNSQVQIRDVRKKINVVLEELRELDNDVKTLAVMMKTVTVAEWDSKCHEIEAKKRVLSHLLSELQLSKKQWRTLKEKCWRRSKKREWLQRRRERWRRRREEERVVRENRHVQMDNWLREMQEGVERTQREEELKKEADAVLWGITQKKNESRRQISLLSALLELRQVRVKRLTAAGNPVSQSQIQTFNTVIQKLKKMWDRRMEECLLEEQVLRGMLTQQDVTEDPVKTHKKLVLQEWEKAIFGTVGSLDSELKGDELIQVRRCWDQFAVPKHTVLATTVPPGWVLPVPAADPRWHQLLKYSLLPTTKQ